MPHAPANILAPYITAWSEERTHPCTVIDSRHEGIAYADEVLTDRDDRGVLWVRIPSHPRGRPVFGEVHPLRQRRAMRRLLCQVCAAPADRTDQGVLWLLQDHRGDWPDWPHRMAVTEPPVCLPCVTVSTRLCPALRRNAVAYRARTHPIAGVLAILYRTGPHGPTTNAEETVIAYDDPLIRWARAINLTRELHDCTLVPLDDLTR